MTQELRVLDFNNIVCKLDRLCISVITGNLKGKNEKSHGYGGTMGHQKESKFTNNEKGTVGMNYGTENPFLDAAGSKCKLLITFGNICSL